MARLLAFQNIDDLLIPLHQGTGMYSIYAGLGSMSGRASDVVSVCDMAVQSSNEFGQSRSLQWARVSHGHY